jgi:hypothetical protein
MTVLNSRKASKKRNSSSTWRGVRSASASKPRRSSKAKSNFNGISNANPRILSHNGIALRGGKVLRMPESAPSSPASEVEEPSFTRRYRLRVSRSPAKSMLNAETKTTKLDRMRVAAGVKAHIAEVKEKNLEGEDKDEQPQSQDNGVGGGAIPVQKKASALIKRANNRKAKLRKASSTGTTAVVPKRLSIPTRHPRASSWAQLQDIPVHPFARTNLRQGLHIMGEAASKANRPMLKKSLHRLNSGQSTKTFHLPPIANGVFTSPGPRHPRYFFPPARRWDKAGETDPAAGPSYTITCPLTGREGTHDSRADKPYNVSDRVLSERFLTLYDSIVAFAREYYSASYCIHVEPSVDVYLRHLAGELSDEFVQIAGFVATGGPAGVAGWEELFVNRELQVALVTGVIWKVLKEHVFAPLLFGGTKEQVKKLEQDEAEQAGFDGNSHCLPK